MEGLASLLGAVGCALREGGWPASRHYSGVWVWGWRGALSLACCGGLPPMLPSVALAPGWAQGYGWRSGGLGGGAYLVRLMRCAWPGVVGLPGPVTRLVDVSLSRTDGLGLLTLAEWLGRLGGVLLCWLLCLGGDQGGGLGGGMGDCSVWGEGLCPLLGCGVTGVWIG
ncbi:hypothetical protein ATANTOWER_024364 [Ataeniobius toweri]|uniref:Uncharacterized protein n=1 Tax=Ataeniobius toweri TaxID=208326 RepID=A0ABU7BK10_9TELE|nr:hypothetical protein [Ataeniobius toweri]